MKRLLCCSYYPEYPQITHHLRKIGKDLDVLRSKYDNIILASDFNAESTDTTLSYFCEIYNLKIWSRIRRVSKPKETELY